LTKKESRKRFIPEKLGKFNLNKTLANDPQKMIYENAI